MKRLQRLFSEHSVVLLLFLSILAVYGLSYYKRQSSFNYWMAHPDVYVVDHVTAMSTMDAYWWLKNAKDWDEDRISKDLGSPLKGYPDFGYPVDVNLLSRLISLGKNLTGGDYYKAGLRLIPISAGLFVFPLFFYFNRLGFGASAVLGGLIGSFSWAYYSRSAMGFVDTDILNLFFPMTVSAFLILTHKDRRAFSNLLLACSAGLFMYLFNWWYQQPSFILIFLVFLAVHLALSRLPLKQALLILAVFAVMSGPHYLWQSIASIQAFLDGYFFPRTTGQINWPNVMGTIQETRQLDLASKLNYLFDFLPLVIAGFAGLLCLYVIRFRQMVLITPLVLIGLWSLSGPIRFSMYLAPFIGIGAGILIELPVRQAAKKFNLRPLVSSAITVASMFGIFFLTISNTTYNFIPTPVVSAATTKAFLEIKKSVPEHAPMLSWWADGYALMEIGEFATFHDNGTHGEIRTTLIAKALTSSRQEDMVALLASIEEYHVAGLRSLIEHRHLSGDQFVSMVFNHPLSIKRDNLFILYTHDMIESFEALSTSGTWAFTRNTSQPMKYNTLPFFSQSGKIINVHGGRIDLDQGVITDGNLVVPLLAAIFVKEGYVVDRINYPREQGVYLQVLIKRDAPPELQVVEANVFQTNFNQQFILGNFDPRYFEEVYNNYPVARVFRVRKQGE